MAWLEQHRRGFRVRLRLPDGTVVTDSTHQDKPAARPANNHILATGIDGLSSLSPELRRLAGIARASTYLGFVAGQDPEQWLESVAGP